MAHKKIEFTVGLFVAGGICIAVAAIIWLGMSRFFEQGQFYVTYFNESVQGLDRDSPVKYRGVSVGRVQSISVAPDGKLIQVVMKIESGQKLESDTVAQLKAVGITGSMFIELDRRKKGELDRTPPLNFPSEYPIVASKPSDITMLLQGIDDFMTQVKSLDLKGISEKVKLTLDSTNQMIADADIRKMAARLAAVIDKAGASMTRFENTLASVERLATGREQDISIAIQQFRSSLEQANGLLGKSAALVGGTSTTLAVMRPQLLATAQNLERASENLSQLMEILSAQPAQLLLGKPPQPRAVEQQEAPE
jgi:phospholipid/cholesterol/gamma-HCH transport system substrate-binding protein